MIRRKQEISFRKWFGSIGYCNLVFSDFDYVALEIIFFAFLYKNGPYKEGSLRTIETLTDYCGWNGLRAKTRKVIGEEWLISHNQVVTIENRARRQFKKFLFKRKEWFVEDEDNYLIYPGPRLRILSERLRKGPEASSKP